MKAKQVEDASKQLKRAEHALVDLNMFALVRSIMEGHLYTAQGKRSANRIIAICNSACQTQLHAMDIAEIRIFETMAPKK